MLINLNALRELGYFVDYRENDPVTGMPQSIIIAGESSQTMYEFCERVRSEVKKTFGLPFHVSEEIIGEFAEKLADQRIFRDIQRIEKDLYEEEQNDMDGTLRARRAKKVK